MYIAFVHVLLLSFSTHKSASFFLLLLLSFLALVSDGLILLLLLLLRVLLLLLLLLVLNRVFLALALHIALWTPQFIHAVHIHTQYDIVCMWFGTSSFKRSKKNYKHTTKYIKVQTHTQTHVLAGQAGSRKQQAVLALWTLTRRKHSNKIRAHISPTLPFSCFWHWTSFSLTPHRSLALSFRCLLLTHLLCPMFVLFYSSFSFASRGIVGGGVTVY